MSYEIFHIAHLISLFLFVGVGIAALIAPENRKRLMMLSGIFSLLAVLTGFGLAGMMKVGFPYWVNVKILCWVILSLLPALAIRKPEKMPYWWATTIIVILTATAMVTMKPM